MIRSRAERLVRVTAVVVFVVSMLLAAVASAEAGTGGRFTFLRDNGSYWGITMPGAGYGEIPFEIDTNGDGRQELAVYYNNRMTIRRDDGSLWGVNFVGAGSGEVPLSVNLRGHGDRRQQFAVYYQGRFTWLNDNGSYSGVTLPGAGRLDLPLAIDTNGDGVQEFAVYRAGRFTFLRPDGSLSGFTFAGATASDVPFAIDTDGNGSQELAVYRDGRMTIRRDDGSYWGFNFQGAGRDEIPLAIDTDGNGRQEFTVYNHASVQLLSKQILANPSIVKDGRVVAEDLEQTADGQAAVAGYRMSSVVLRSIVHLAYSHSMHISSLTGNGTGHSSGSRHYSGAAFDVNRIDEKALTGRDYLSLDAINIVKNDLVSGSRFGQLGCPTPKGAPAPSLPAGITQIGDSCDHLHVDVPVGTA